MRQSDQDIRNRLLLARLPSMPQILVKLIELCQTEDWSMNELAQLIANDAGMASRVLSVANSAAYYRGGSKVGLLQALNTLGADMTKSLVINESVFQTFNGFPHSGSTDLRCFWKHSLTTAVTAREIAKKIGYAQTEIAYLAGLLHDIGRLALLAAAPKEYGGIFHTLDNAALCALEQQKLQITHPEAGAWLIDRWSLDSFLADSVLYHHEDPSRLASAHPLIRIVHLAHAMDSMPAGAPLDANAGALCRLPGQDLRNVLNGSAIQVSKEADHLGIDLSDVDATQACASSVAMHVGAEADSTAQKRLTDEVRNMALSAELNQSFSQPSDVAQLLDVVRKNASVHFNLDDSVAFIVDAGGQSAVGISFGEHLQRLGEFSLPLSGGIGIAQSAALRRPVFLERGLAPLSFEEDQLFRVLRCEALVCIPLVSAKKCLGLLVSGVPAWRKTDLKSLERFLLAFGALAGAALDTLCGDRQEIDQLIAGFQQEHREQSRKVSHEINNSLAITKNYLGVIDDKLHRNETVTGELLILQEEIDRVGNILGEFAGEVPRLQAAPTDLNRVVNNLVRLFRESKFLPAIVRITTSGTDETCLIHAPSDSLKQVLINLIKNAVEALARGGQIDVRNNGRVSRNGKFFIELLVSDNGPGLPDDVFANLYKPVRSTKAGANRGLGLSIVHDKVGAIGGTIRCQSSKAGTVFAIQLPAVAVPNLAAAMRANYDV